MNLQIVHEQCKEKRHRERAHKKHSLKLTGYIRTSCVASACHHRRKRITTCPVGQAKPLIAEAWAVSEKCLQQIVGQALELLLWYQGASYLLLEAEWSLN